MTTTTTGRLALLFFTFFVTPIFAATNSWTGTGGDGLWNNPANWSLNAVPAADDVAIINLPGTYAVEVDSDVTVMTLYVGATGSANPYDTNIYPAEVVGMQTLRLTGSHTFTCNEAVVTPAANLALESGTLAASQLLINGELKWSSGVLYGGSFPGSHATISPIGKLSFDGAGNKTINTLWMTNHGTATWNGGSLSIGPGAFHNVGTFVLQTNCELSGFTDFYNSGTLAVSAVLGELVLQSYHNFWNSGTILVDTNSTLALQGTQIWLGNGTTFAGEGLLRLNGWAQVGGVFNLAGNFELSSGAINGSCTWQGDGEFTWSSGSMNDGNQTFGADTRLKCVNGGGKTFSSITNLGTVIWAADADQLDGGVFENDGTFVVESNCSVSVESFVNTGTILRPADSGEAFLFNTPIFFWEGNFRNRGMIVAEANSVLQLSGEGYLLENGTAINGEGIVRLAGAVAGDGDVALGGTLELHFGTIAGNHTWTGTGQFHWRSGRFENEGVSLFGPDTQLHFIGSEQKEIWGHSITNLGTARWQADGGSLFNDGVFCSAGTLLLEADCMLWGSGAFYNLGTIQRDMWMGEAFLFNGHTFHNRGTIHADEYSSILLSGEGYLLENGSHISGDGTVRFGGSGDGDGDVVISGTFELDFGTISGNHNWSGPGRFVWRSGGFGFDGASTFAPGARLDFDDSYEKTINDYVITNLGTATWLADGGQVAGNNGVFLNQGTFVVNANCTFQGSGDFINEGTILKPADSGEAFLFNSRNFLNRGVVHAGTNALLNLTGELYQFQNGSQITGEGTVRFGGVGGGDGDVAVLGTFELYYGTITGNHDWSGSGTFVWRSGGFDSPGMNAFHEGARMVFAGSEQKLLGSCTLSNAGTMVWQADGAHLSGSGGLFVNSGTFVMETNCALQGTGEFINNGTIMRPDHSGEAFLFNSRSFYNRGIISAGTNATLMLSGENFSFENGSEIAGDGLVRFGGLGAGNGDITLTGTLQLYYGTLGGNHTWNGPGTFEWRSGGFDGTGTSVFAEDANLRFVGSEQKILGVYTITNLGIATWQADGASLGGAGTFVNEGELVVQAACALQGSGDFVNNGIIRQAGGSLAISQPFINNGTVSLSSGVLSAAEYEPGSPTYEFALGGTGQGVGYGYWSLDNFAAGGVLVVSLTNGFVPAPDSTFKLVESFNATGAFISTNLPVLPSNMVWQVTSDTMGVLLTVAQAPWIIAPPTDVVVHQGTNVTFSVGAIGSGTLSYQWFFEGEPLSGSTLDTVTLLNVQPTNQGIYSIVISNEIGVASAEVSLTVTGDSARPSLAIVSPKANLVTNAASVLLTGTAKDNVGVTEVQAQVNSGSAQSATLIGPRTNVNWSLLLDLVPGTNVVSVKALDLAGNWTNSVRSFFRVATSPLTINVTGLGTTIPTTNAFGVPTNNAPLQIGRGYRVTAVPGSNYVFTNWTGTISSSTNVLNFVMESNMVLTANFIPNPFIPASGNYNGLFYEETGLEHHSAGFFTLKVNPTFAYSGKLLVEGDALTFSGKFGLQGSATRTVSRAKFGKPDLQVTLALDFTNYSGHVTGTVQCSNLWTATLLGDRAVTDLATTTNYAASYTMLIPGLSDPNVGPPGYSYGTALVSTNGRVRFAGKLADGSPAGASVTISRDGQWPLFVRAYPQRVNQTNMITAVVRTNVAVFNGEIAGWLTITNVPLLSNKAAAGSLSWIKTAVTNGAYLAGFTNQTDVQSSIFVKQPRGVRVLSLTNGAISFAHGNLASAFTNAVLLQTNNSLTVTGVNTNTTKPAVSAATGLLSGSFRHPDNTNATTRFFGVVLQEQSFGAGFFMGTNRGGLLLLEPR